jgi:hypothetical protein
MDFVISKQHDELSDLTVGIKRKAQQHRHSNYVMEYTTMQSKIAVGVFATMALMGNVYAADINDCPKVSEIKSSAYTSDDKNIPAPYNEGYKYTATANGKTWTGVAMGINDDYLDKKYNLKAVSYDGSICSYGGKTVVENGETAVPYLKLKAS